MGQPISEEMRRRLARHPQVREVTQQHVVLTDGRVVDPRSFEVDEWPLRFVLKLVRCGCLFKSHPAGLHVLTGGQRVQYGDGSFHNFWFAPAECPKGEWVVEERIEKKARVLRG